jgi:hypothetical protein
MGESIRSFPASNPIFYNPGYGMEQFLINNHKGDGGQGKFTEKASRLPFTPLAVNPGFSAALIRP